MIEATDFCSKRTSIRLKELGYNDRTFCYYTPNGDFIHNTNPFRGGYFEDSSFSYNSLPEGVMGFENVDAPLIYEAMKFLRGKGVEVDSLNIPSNNNRYAYMIWVGDALYEDSDEDKVYYSTYEHAMDDAIYHACGYLIDKETEK